MAFAELPPLGLYIHLPWCERKCPYCDFNSHESRELPERQYIDALLADLEGEQALAEGRSISTLFIGGGTPSLFSADSIRRLLHGIGERLELAADLEATMEANPGSAEAEKFHGFRAAGINRLSLGVQSFNDTHLQALGRVHSSDQAHAAIAMVQAANFASFNIDLMHGLPAQTMADAVKDVATAARYQPPHLSWYQLTIEPNTLFHKQPPQLPHEDTLAAISDRGEVLLKRERYRAYEVSAWAHDGMRCRHNLNYWTFGDYLALGAGAHGKISFRDGRIMRYTKRRQPGRYLEATGDDYTASRRFLQPEELPAEYMLNALRLHRGFNLAHYVARTGLAADSVLPRIDKLMARGLLELAQAGEQIRASTLGRRFLDDVVAEFMPA